MAINEVDELLAPIRRRALVAEVLRDLGPTVYNELAGIAELREVDPDEYGRALRAMRVALVVLDKGASDPT
jgi:hypothetical protein